MTFASVRQAAIAVVIIVLATSAVHAQITVDGDLSDWDTLLSDPDREDVLEYADTVGDVATYTTTYWNGFDFSRALFHYDGATDTLYVAFDTADKVNPGVAGDSDAGGTPNDDPDPGLDVTGFGPTEIAVVAFDFKRNESYDGVYDLAAGWDKTHSNGDAYEIGTPVNASKPWDGITNDWAAGGSSSWAGNYEFSIQGFRAGVLARGFDEAFPFFFFVKTDPSTSGEDTLNGLYPNPTCVDVQDFVVCASPGGPLFTWVAGAEADVAGYNLLRETEDGHLCRLNSALIAARNGESPIRYEFTGQGTPGSGRYYLEIIALDGTTRRCIPASPGNQGVTGRAG